MNESEFWVYLEGAWKKGRVPQVSMVTSGTGAPTLEQAGGYIGGHDLLPQGYDRIPVSTIAEMGELLLRKGLKASTQEAIMMILAHHGCDEALAALRKFFTRARGEIKFFAELALDECEMWNEDYH